MNTIRIQAAALIDAPASHVYEILADYRNGHPNILPKSFFTAMTVVAGGTGAGTVFNLTTKLFGQERSASFEVTEPHPGCLLAERDPVSGLLTTFRVSPEHRGHHAHVTIVTDIPRSPGIRGAIEAWILPRALAKVYNDELRMLGAFARSTASKQIGERPVPVAA